jgi:ubiquitin-conjugating enzyme E2 L3
LVAQNLVLVEFFFSLIKMSKAFFKHLRQIQRSPNSNFQDMVFDEANSTTITGVLVVAKPPYNIRGLKVELTFSVDYPFVSPEARFITPVYHMSVNENGTACVPALLAANWKPSNDFNTIIEALVELITNFEPEAPVRGEIAEQYSKDRQAFDDAVRAHLLAHGEPISTPLPEEKTAEDGEATEQDVDMTNVEEATEQDVDMTNEEETAEKDVEMTDP